MRWTRAVPVCAGVCLWAAFAAPTLAQQHVGEYAQADVQRGEQLFETRCTSCHGDAGNQVPGVALLSGSFRRASDDAQLKGVIRGGIPGTGMPQGNYSDAELTALVAYLRTSAASRTTSSGIRLGDAARGAAIFHDKGQCEKCHRVGGTGGFRGPNLSEIGVTRSDRSLLQSMVEPSAEIIPLNQELRVVTRRGQTVVGRRMNEDTHSIQMIQEEQGRLIAIMKSDIREIAPVKVSPMPSYKGKLSDSEIADVLAYLRSLKPAE
jgi:putative heme-binding domain-containing protein